MKAAFLPKLELPRGAALSAASFKLRARGSPGISNGVPMRNYASMRVEPRTPGWRATLNAVLIIAGLLTTWAGVCVP